MARPRKYPKANTTAQWWEEEYSRATMNPVSKLLLHSTETASWPGYSRGASAPTITYNPWVAAGQRWRQHCYLDRSSRALRDPSGTLVRENQDGVVQVEIIGYCDPALAKKYGHSIAKLPDHAYEDLGAFLAFLHTEYDVPLVRAAQWLTYPESGRADSPIRMSGPEYDRFRGILGHQHASGNTHGDPGMTNAQVDRILTVAKRIVGGATPAKPPTPPEDDMTAAQMQELKNFIEARTQAYAIANNNYTRQVLATATKAILAAAGDDDSTAAVNQLNAELDARDAKMQADIQAISDKLDAPAEPPASS